MHPYLLSRVSKTALMPLLCGMLVYSDLTSMVEMIVLGGNGVAMLKMVCKK